jgi:hypothetical protein
MQTREIDKNPEKFMTSGWTHAYGTFAWTSVNWYQCDPHKNENDEIMLFESDDDGGFALRLVTDAVLYQICVFVFAVCIFKDIRQTVEMAILLSMLPTRSGGWVTFPSDDVDSLEMQFRVGCMPLKWKILNLVTLCLPKLVIAVSLALWGTIFLKNSMERSETVLDAVALIFILELDELLFSALCGADLLELMDNLQPPEFKSQMLRIQALKESFPDDDESHSEQDWQDAYEDDEEDAFTHRHSLKDVMSPLGHWLRATCLNLLALPVLLGFLFLLMVAPFNYQCRVGNNHDGWM